MQRTVESLIVAIYRQIKLLRKISNINLHPEIESLIANDE